MIPTLLTGVSKKLIHQIGTPNGWRSRIRGVYRLIQLDFKYDRFGLSIFKYVKPKSEPIRYLLSAFDFN